jgi:ABC-2 type transport system permease protein
MNATLSRLNDTVRVILSMIELEIRRLMHDRTEIYLRAVQPLLWLVVFGSVVGSLNSIPTGNVPYIDFIMPGVLIQSTTTIAIFFGLIVIWERESGVLKKLFASPSSLFAIVAGRSFAAGVRATFQMIFIIPFAMLIGVRVLLNPLYLLSAIAIVFVASAGFASLSLMIAAILKSRERFMGLGQVIVLPLFFGSNALYPLSAMPPLLRDFAQINPMTYIVDAARGLLITGNLSQLPLDVGVTAGFTLVLFCLATWSFNRIIE